MKFGPAYQPKELDKSLSLSEHRPMNKKKILSTLSRAPNWLNILILRANIPATAIFGVEYRNIYSSFGEIDETKFIEFIKRTAPKARYYNNNIGCEKIEEIKTTNDFKALFPLIDKNLVMARFEEFSATDESNASDLCSTGGTSGKPMTILLPKKRYANELGSLHALWKKIGYEFSIRAVVRNERIPGRDYLINPITKEFIFDGFRSEENYLEKIYTTMKKYNIGFFHGYTSNAERFAKFLLTKQLDYSFLKGIISTSENLYEHQISTFKKLDGVKHMNFYGHSEKLTLAGWCEEGHCYHFYDSYGYAELVDSEGNAISKTGQIGEIVGSTNYNDHMPLFRYKTGDYAEKGPEICSGCGFSGLSVYKILGRWHGEKIYNSDGSYVTTTALNLHSSHYEKIEALQYYQPHPGIVEIRVKPGAKFDNATKESMLMLLASKFAPTTKIKINTVPQIQKQSNGKFLLLISDINANT